MADFYGNAAQIIAIANKGNSVASALTEFGGPRSHSGLSIAREFSEVSMILGSIGQKIQHNEKLIKWNQFSKLFGSGLSLVEKLFEKYAAALRKVKEGVDLNSEQKDEQDDEGASRKSYGKRLEWALGKDPQHEEDDDELSDTSDRLYLLQSLISLVVLHSIGKREDLSTEQRSELIYLKENIKWMLTKLRNFELLSIDLRANVSSITQSIDPVMISTYKGNHATTNFNTSTLSISKSLGGSTTASLIAASIANNKHDDFTTETPPYILYEAWSISPVIEQRSEVSTEIFGVRRKCSAKSGKGGYQHISLPASQDELRAYASKISAKGSKISRFERILEESHAHASLNRLLHERELAGRGKHWTIEVFEEMPQAKCGWFKKTNKQGMQPTYLVILKGGDGVERIAPPNPHEDVFGIRAHPHVRVPPNTRVLPYGRYSPPCPPPPEYILAMQSKNSRLNRPYSSRVIKNPTVKVELTQTEAENVINDFLASFSTVFDDIPYEQRGTTLNSVGLSPDYDYDSDSSTSDESLGDE